jgi:ligand-binding sensor domain-containing protein
LNRSISTVFGAVLLGVSEANAQSVPEKQQIHRVNDISQTINAFIHQDGQGFVWIASTDGLNRFDGRNTRIYRPDPQQEGAILGGNIQSDFFETRSGDIWFSTELGINCYRRNRDVFDHYSLSRAGSTHHYVFFLEQDRFLWVVCENKLYKLDTHNTSEPPVLLLDHCYQGRYSVDTNSNGAVTRLYLCFWTTVEGVKIIDFEPQGRVLDSVMVKSADFKVRASLLGAISSTKQDNTLWINTLEGLYEMDLKPSVKVRKVSLPASEQGIATMTKMSETTLLMTGTTGRFYQFNVKNRSFFPIFSQKSNQTINTNQVETCKILQGNYLWWSVRGDGVYYAALSNYALNTSPALALVQSAVWNIYQAENRFYLSGTDSYLLETDAARNHLAQVDGAPYSKLFSDVQGNRWLFSTKGLYSFNHALKRWQLKLFLRDFASFMDINVHRNQLMVACLEGIYSIDLNTLNTQKISNEGAYCLARDPAGNLWQGAYNFIQIWACASGASGE